MPDIREAIAKEMHDEELTNLTKHELDCLEALADHEVYCLPLQMIADYIGHGLTIDDVRTAARSLAAKGLAYYSRGLFTEDGRCAGSGYGVTSKGLEVWNNMLPALLEKGRKHAADDHPIS